MKGLKDPVFQVDGETSPVLAGFYVFWTMIIVLQVLVHQQHSEKIPI